MVPKRLMSVLFGILVISAWVFSSTIQVGAETMNYKLYSHVGKDENVNFANFGLAGIEPGSQTSPP